MEHMASVHSDYDGSCIEETCNKQLLPPSSPDISDIFGDPQVNTRVGDDFQVEVPSMITESERLQLLRNPADSGVIVDFSHSFLMGLPIPIMWVKEVNNIEDNDEVVKPNGPVEARKIKKIHFKLKKKGSVIGETNLVGLQGKEKFVPLDVGLDHEKESRAVNSGTMVTGETNLVGLHKSKGFCPVPGSQGDLWSDAEVNGFLLGLYIFGKNFVQIKRFLGNKSMGEILSFYYGEFYRSDHYRRWSDSRKVRSRRCITGRKIFTGWRQHELLSRLLPHVSEEFQSSLLEGSKLYAEGRTSLEEYVSSLKSTAGIHILVKAVGIGKGKEDLTGLAMEPGKTNKVFPVCPNLPTGKACSSLTPSDIVKLLTGGFRLSKARCNDIFWEAVWPRLLARGWHSEQPKNQGYVSSKHYLVFLMPGVKKFSRRKLLKGDHYFDSVSDVLSKVASEPKLLELEAEEATVRSCNEDGWIPEVTSDPDDPSDHQRHCYLKPRVSICNPNRLKFTVVDTSSVHGGKSSNLRELRYLPVESKIISQLTNHLKDNEENFFKNSPDEYEVYAADMQLNGKKNIKKAHHSGGTFDSGGPNCMKFTIVDTSLVHGKKSSKVRELRHSPVELKNMSRLTSLLRVTEGTSSEDSLDGHEPDAVGFLLKSEKNNDNMNLHKCISIVEDTNQKATIDDSDTTANKMVESHKDQKATMSDDRQPKRTIKHQFSRRVKSGQSDYVAPAIKRRKLTACAKAEKNRIVENVSEGMGSKQMGLCLALKSPDAIKNVSSQVGPREKLPLIISSAKVSPKEENGRGKLCGKSFDIEMSYGKNQKHKNQPSLDLNLPQVPVKAENGEVLMMEVEDGQGINADNSCLPSNTKKLDPEALRTSVDVGTAEQHPNMNPRRQSTRNRPPTIRALEALASGFLNVQRRQKSTGVRTQESPFSSPSRKARSRVKANSNRGSASTKTVEIEEKDVDEACNVNKETVSRPLGQIEEKWLTGY